jgi:hypothetical protein
MLGHNEKAIELLRVLGEHRVQPCGYRGKRRRRAKAEEDHASVRLSLDKDEFPEIPIAGNENAVRSVGYGENIAISQAGRIFSSNANDIVS